MFFLFVVFLCTVPCDLPDRTKGRGFRFGDGPQYVKTKDPYKLMEAVARQPVVIYLTAGAGSREGKRARACAHCMCMCELQNAYHHAQLVDLLYTLHRTEAESQ